jgi:gliding motility-associated-like protein
VQWNWSFGDGFLGNTKQAQHLYTAANTYNVSLYIINSQGCNSDTLNQQFTVHPYPVVDAGPDRVVLQGGSITIQSNVTGNDLQYLWSPATYLNSTTAINPVASDMQDDITYTLTVTARGGCKNLDKMFVKVLKAPRIPNTFTPNADGINDVWTIEYLDTYPSNRVQVFTRTGQLVFESRGYKTPWDGKFNGKPLPFDTYYYIVEPENGRKPITGYVTIVK